MLHSHIPDTAPLPPPSATLPHTPPCLRVTPKHQISIKQTLTLTLQVGLTRLDLKLKNEASPPINYLWVSLALGWGLLVWLFFEAGWKSKWVVRIVSHA